MAADTIAALMKNEKEIEVFLLFSTIFSGPEQAMQLQLQTNRKMITQQQLGAFGGGKFLNDRRKQQLGTLVQMITTDTFTSPRVVIS